MSLAKKDIFEVLIQHSSLKRYSSILSWSILREVACVQTQILQMMFRPLHYRTQLAPSSKDEELLV